MRLIFIQLMFHFDFSAATNNFNISLLSLLRFCNRLVWMVCFCIFRFSATSLMKFFLFFAVFLHSVRFCYMARFRLEFIFIRGTVFFSCFFCYPHAQINLNVPFLLLYVTPKHTHGMNVTECGTFIYYLYVCI